MREYENASKGVSGNESGWESESGDGNESEYENESASTVVGESDNGMHMRM